MALNWHSTPDDMLYIANDCGARAVIAMRSSASIDKLPLMPVICPGGGSRLEGIRGGPVRASQRDQWRDLLATAPIDQPPKVARADHLRRDAEAEGRGAR